MNIAIDTPSCVTLRKELESLDDLVFQLKYICMEPMLKMVEEIEANLNKFLQTESGAEKKGMFSLLLID